MLSQERASILAERRWVDDRRGALERAHAALESAFAALAG